MKLVSSILLSLVCVASSVAQSPLLSAAQRRILESPALAMDCAFSFEGTAGPQFSDAEKSSQRIAASNIVPMVMAAFREGAMSVRIPSGDYRFGHERWNREGVVYPLEFDGLRREDAQTFTIDATGATFWFDLPDDQAPKAHFCVGFRNCRNVVFKGATLDRGTRGNFEGRITQIDFEKNRIELQLLPGCDIPEKFSGGLEQRILPFKADGTFCAPLYALQSGGLHLKYKSAVPGTTSGRCWIEMQDATLLERIRETKWSAAVGEQGVLRVGDGISCVYSVAIAMTLDRCAQMTMEGLHVFVAKANGSETGGYGAHLWKNCYFGPRPGTGQWQGGEGFMFNGTRHGTTLDNVTIVHAADDCANFHGYWSRVETVNDHRVTFAKNEETHRPFPRDVAIGDSVFFYARDGTELGAAVVTAIESNAVVFDKPVANFANAMAEWIDHECAGWTVQNCNWHDDYQRLLIQSGPGVVRHCTFTRLGSSIELNSVMDYVEGGVPRDITIKNNVFTDVNPQPGGAAIAAHVSSFERGKAPVMRNIVITNNIFSRPLAEAIVLKHCEDAQVNGNLVRDATKR
jgi:hypothetical protein